MTPVLVALGSNLGDRRLNLRRAIGLLARRLTLVRLSSVWETAPVGATVGAGTFFNMVAAGFTASPAKELLKNLHEIETEMGRRRRVRNESRLIDLDLILYGAALIRSADLAVPHPRYRDRRFVTAPLRELRLGWVDPSTGLSLSRLQGAGDANPAGSVYGPGSTCRLQPSARQ